MLSKPIFSRLTGMPMADEYKAVGKITETASLALDNARYTGWFIGNIKKSVIPTTLNILFSTLLLFGLQGNVAKGDTPFETIEKKSSPLK